VSSFASRSDRHSCDVIQGLFIGFTFWRAKNTLQGTQNKLFVRDHFGFICHLFPGADAKAYQAIFMSTILSTPLAQGLMVPFCYLRSVYEIRERSSKTYTWTAMITANLLVETPWNLLGTCIFFFCWYWTVGFESSRAGYTVSFIVVFF
jgi:ATP-binding cassette subfamily G (WHITE) protein 2 (SNQ2)